MKALPSDGISIVEVAEIKKQRFLKFVEQLALLRDLQFENNIASSITEHARKIAVQNLPSNAMRAAAILVDYFHGFPPSQNAFRPPDWVTSLELLPENLAGSLVCTGFSNVCDLGEDDVVVLTSDLPEHGLQAGMTGIIKELPDDEEIDDYLVVEFGEPLGREIRKIKVSLGNLRGPRPGDLIENFRY
jgi:hypothetical protein